MDKFEKSRSSFIIFILIIIGICVGGYYLVKYQNNKTTESKEFSNSSVSEDIKINDDKDYIYFTNETKISDNFSVTYKDINININNDDAKKLEGTLNSKMNDAKNSVVKTTDDLVSDYSIVDDIYSADIIEYKVYSTSDFLSLIVSSYSYNVINGNSDPSNSYYVFDLKNGNIVDNNSILKQYNITDQEVRSEIRSYLSKIDDADIDTILNNPYYLTVADNGKVMINFVVKTSSFNYNESIEMD